MKDEKVGPLRVIHVDDVPYRAFPPDPKGWIAEGAWIKNLTPPESGVYFIAFKFPAHYRAPAHWHDFDTIYIIKSGEFYIEDEGTFRPGDVRWVRGGTAYGAESAGPDGCEVYIVSMGPIAMRDPTTEPPPGGYRRDVVGDTPP